MLALLLTTMAIAQLPNANPKFIELKTQLENYGFEVNIEVPPSFNLPEQQIDFQRRRVSKPYGLLSTKNKAIWINPIVFELGNSNAVLIHEAVHAAQYCAGNGNIQTIGLELEPIPQARPFFKRYANIHSQAVEKEAYTVQSQPNSYELVQTLLKTHCHSTMNNEQ